MNGKVHLTSLQLLSVKTVADASGLLVKRGQSKLNETAIRVKILAMLKARDVATRSGIEPVEQLSCS